jgi:hypothetical protein
MVEHLRRLRKLAHASTRESVAATYRLHSRDAELVTLDAVPAGTGTGTAFD